MSLLWLVTVVMIHQDTLLNTVFILSWNIIYTYSLIWRWSTREKRGGSSMTMEKLALKRLIERAMTDLNILDLVTDASSKNSQRSVHIIIIIIIIVIVIVIVIVIIFFLGFILHKDM